MEGNILNFVENTFSYFFSNKLQFTSALLCFGLYTQGKHILLNSTYFRFVLTPEGKGNCVEIPSDFSFPLFNIQSILQHLSSLSFCHLAFAAKILRTVIYDKAKIAFTSDEYTHFRDENIFSSVRYKKNVGEHH